MSIATLKKKTLSKYNNVSVNSATGFSLNGTFRNQGYVGQTSLSRSFPRTPMKGITPRGHGGCCGQYYVGPIIQSGVTSTEDSTVVKVSVINTRGMLAERLCQDPCTTVKPDNNLNSNSQGAAIERKRKTTTACIVSTVNTVCKTCPNTTIFGKYPPIRYTKPIESYSPISQGQYLASLGEKCVSYDQIISPTNVSRTPFACP